MIIKNNGLGANLRSNPGDPIVSGSSNIVTLLPENTTVEALSIPTVNAVLNGSSYTWQAVRAVANNRLGWVVNLFLSSGITPPPPTPTTTGRIGVHVMQDGIAPTAQFLSLLPANITLPSATVLNEPKIVALLQPRTKYLLYRDTNHENPPPIPDDFTQARIVGQLHATASLGWIGALPEDVRVICMNEREWSQGHGGFWLGYLETLNAAGRKGCIGSYGVGQPEPAQWATMVEALRYAAANGHLVVLHSYCQQGTAPGMLSADGKDYEFRHAELYNAVPIDARPLLVLSEDGHEFTRGLFEGTHAFIEYSDKEQQNDQQYSYLVSRNKWTGGGHGDLGWDTSSIDTALPALANFISTGRYP